MSEDFAADFAAMIAGGPVEAEAEAPASNHDWESEPVAHSALDLFAPTPADIALIRAMHGEPEPELAEPTGPVDFDGGARETPAPPSDPVREHDALVLGLSNRLPNG